LPVQQFRSFCRSPFIIGYTIATLLFITNGALVKVITPRKNSDHDQMFFITADRKLLSGICVQFHWLGLIHKKKARSLMLRAFCSLYPATNLKSYTIISPT
jgi:hypothetical protein